MEPQSILSGDICLAILDELDDGILIADDQGRIVEANRAVCILYGYTRHQLCQMQFGDLVAKTVSTLPISTIVPKAGPGIETWHCGSGGELLFVNVLTRSFFSTPAHGSLTVIRVRDSSFTHQQEVQKKKEDQIYRTVVESGPSMIARALSDTTLTFANDTYCKYFGHERKEIIGRKLSEIASDEITKKAVCEYFASYAKNPKARVHENLLYNGKGEQRWVQFTESPILDENGNLLEMQIIAVDIHEHKLAEIELRRNEAKYRAMLEQSNVGIALLAMETGKILEVNKKMCDMFGYSQKELLSFTNRRLSTETDDDIRNAVDALRNNSSLPSTLIRVIAKNGKVIEVERLAKLLDFAGDNMVLISLHDVSEKKQIESLMREQTEELKQRIDQLQIAWAQTIDVLAAASEAKDPYTSGHQKRVAGLAVSIGKELNLHEDQITGLRMASLIHDIGKITLPTEILSKPGALSCLEYQLVQLHVNAGHDLLKSLDLPWDVADVVYQHHERCNGHGYPNQLQGDEILFKAKILAVADVVEAMSSHRPYRPAVGVEAALCEIEKEKGNLYDINVVEACLRVFQTKDCVFAN